MIFRQEKKTLTLSKSLIIVIRKLQQSNLALESSTHYFLLGEKTAYLNLMRFIQNMLLVILDLFV